MLALAQPTEARIVYTRTNAVIGSGGQSHYNLDLNHDGKADFDFKYYYASAGFWLEVLPAPRSPRNGIWGWRGPCGRCPFSGYAAPLTYGVSVGPGAPFRQGNNLMVGGSIRGSSFRGFWFYAQNNYLGLKFFINGKAHYGWARLSNSGNLTVILTGYAYETVPNRSIVTGRTKGPDESDTVEEANPAALGAPAPEPATLGLLAMGWPELPVWRRKESVGATQ